MSFDDIIGQEKIKKKLEFFLAAQKVSSISPNILFVAPRGCGKTLMAQTYASKLVTKEGKKRDQFIVNCSVLKSLRTFVDEVLEPILRTSEATLFFDEASEIPEDVRMALLTILNPNKDNKNKFAYGDRNFDIDFKRFTFLFATTEPHKIPPPLADRLERIDLEEYSINNLAAIVKKSVSQDISEAALLEISKVLRGNARKAMQMANHINAYLATSKVKSFGIKDWKDFSSKMGILPLGLSPLELKILKTLAEKPETTLTNLSAKTFMTRQSLQRDLENYLQRLNLIEVTPTGRKLTIQGRQYLEGVKA